MAKTLYSEARISRDMSLWQTLILGGVQGLTEFLPISSSGHLIFIPKFFGWADQGLAFDVVVHVGTLMAVVVYFRKRLLVLVRNFRLSRSRGSLAMTDENRAGWFVILSVIPAALTGFFFGDWIEDSARSAWVVGVSLITWAVVLAAADRLSLKHKNIKTLKQITWKDMIFISCVQAIALIPGTSRSGITMTAGLLSRLDKTSAVEFSFLMAVPVIALAGMYELVQIIRHDVAIAQFSNLIIGFFAAAVSGFVAIWALMKIIQRWSFMPFVVYRVVIGVAILVYLT